jgi:N-acetyl-anhydromuramyl-L-alanine amidase AmpD
MHGQPLKAKVDEIRRWHRARGWSDIGYHYVIDRDGKISVGRPVEKTGAHVKGHNRGTIGVCLLGGHGSSADDEFSDNFTISQDKALWSFLADLKQKHSITKVSGHNQYAPKACPGFNVPIWIRGHEQKPPKKRAFAGLRRFFKSLFG